MRRLPPLAFVFLFVAPLLAETPVKPHVVLTGHKTFFLLQVQVNGKQSTTFEIALDKDTSVLVATPDARAAELFSADKPDKKLAAL